jgi:hypothetical protein
MSWTLIMQQMGGEKDEIDHWLEEIFDMVVTALAAAQAFRHRI